MARLFGLLLSLRSKHKGRAMAYLAIKKVKGRYYAYRQESYREGGQVRTRTVEYLGAVESAVAERFIATKREAGKLAAQSLVDTVRKSSQKLSRAADKPAKRPEPIPRPKPIVPPIPRKFADEQRKAEILDAVGHKANPHVTQIKNGDEWLEVDTRTGEVVRVVNRVITTNKQTPTLRNAQDGLKLPKNLAKYGVNETPLKRSHLRYCNRLKELQINPAYARRSNQIRPPSGLSKEP